MHRAIRGFTGFTRELDRGMAMMRGEVKPGTYNLRHYSLRDIAGSLERLGGQLHSGGRRLAIFALLLAMILWGSVFVATKEVMEGAGPFTVAAGRFAIGLAVLLPLAYREGFRAGLVVRPVYLLFGFTGIFLSYGLQNLSLLFTSGRDLILPVGAELILFAGASLALIVVPGPDMIYVITRGVSQGRMAGLLSAWGACSGLLVHTALAAVGLSALLAESAVAFSVVKYAGAAYLLYLGIRALLSKTASGGSAGEAAPPVRPGIAFAQGFASDVLNPKVALFFVAFLPQFVNPAAGTVASQMLLYVAVYTLLSVAVFSCIAFFSRGPSASGSLARGASPLSFDGSPVAS